MGKTHTIKLDSGLQLDLCTEDDEPPEVWLSPEEWAFGGLCIGIGGTVREAIADAMTALEEAVRVLQQPHPEWKD